MNLDPLKVEFSRSGDDLTLHIDGVAHSVERVARAFPKTDPDHYVGFLDTEGHEIGILEDPRDLDPDSKSLLEEELKAIYFTPTVKEILSVQSRGTGSQWRVLTDDGEHAFRILGRDALNGSHPPQIEITSESGRKYRIENYWDLDPDSRDTISDLIPDAILKARYARSSVHSHSGGSMMRMR